MQNKTLFRQRHREQGQTIILVAVSLISLLAMAALAIDIVTLYVARSEIQRATDAAALAGAKAIADSGFTSVPSTDANYGNAKSLALSMATNAINAVTLATPPINLVAGGQPLVVGSPSFDFTTHPGSYQVTVSLNSSNLHTFFSKIWGRGSASVKATATAEAYNPANLPSITPIAPQSVKPWLIANADPTVGLPAPPLVDTTTPNWVVDSGVIGKTFDLVSDCDPAFPTICKLLDIGTPWTHGTTVDYLPALVTTPNTANVCPACAGATDYENSIECADVATSYKVLSCGGGAAHAQWDNTINPSPAGNNASALGAECLIHATTSGGGMGQDSLIEPGPIFSAPYTIHAQSGPTLVSTSSSIVTIPIFDTATFDPLVNNVTVVGFLQAFIQQVNPGPSGTINLTVLNIAGCNSPNTANPVVGGSGSSPVPVRLITPP
jgi:hypothetical protein